MRSSTPKVRARQLPFSPPASLSLYERHALCDDDDDDDYWPVLSGFTDGKGNTQKR